MANPLAQQDRKIPSGSESTSRDPLSIPSEVKASIRVLVVDDERTLRESCASVLQMDGYNVTLIGRGEEALETVRRRKFDIILVEGIRTNPPVLPDLTPISQQLLGLANASRPKPRPKCGPDSSPCLTSASLCGKKVTDAVVSGGFSHGPRLDLPSSSGFARVEPSLN